MTELSQIPSIIKRTNKYVYLDDGTHMFSSDYHQLKQGLTNKMALIHAKEFKDSQQTIVILIKNLNRLQKLETELEEQIYLSESNVNFLNDSLKEPKTNWEDYYRKQVKEKDELQTKLEKIAQTVYSNFEFLPILKNFKCDEGIKFIIQENEDTSICRFRFDPYQMVANFHSSLSHIHQNKKYSTVNGGWMRTVGDKIILYGKSGDYGCYKDNQAITAAQVIFPDKIICSHPDRSWENVKGLYL